MNFHYHLLWCKLFDNESFMSLSLSTRWLFIWLWGNRHIDYEGRQTYTVESIKRQAFPYDNGIDINKSLGELQAEGFINVYVGTVEGKERNIVEVPKFPELQRFRKSISSELPPPDGLIEFGVKPKVKFVKPEILPLSELENQLHEDLYSTWDSYKAMCAQQRKTGKVSESVLTAHLTAILESGLSVEAIRYGLLAAINKGADNPNYALVAARGFSKDSKYEAPVEEWKEERTW